MRPNIPAIGRMNLTNRLTKYARIAKKIVMKRDYNKGRQEHRRPYFEYLRTARFTRDIYGGNEYAGVVTGLAWTSVGGEILFIETSLSKAKAGKLTLTGNLGDVMKESAVIALEYLKAHADYLNIPYNSFEENDVHIHVPEGLCPRMAHRRASPFSPRWPRPSPIAKCARIWPWRARLRSAARCCPLAE